MLYAIDASFERDPQNVQFLVHILRINVGQLRI